VSLIEPGRLFRTRNGVGACWAFLFDLCYQPHRIQQVRIDNNSMAHGKTHGKDSKRDRNDEGCSLGSQCDVVYENDV
jgi:hypothetical protein